MKTAVSIYLALLMTAAAAPSWADPIVLRAGDTMQKQIEVQKGKKVAIRLASGEELSGTVKSVSGNLLHLGEISGREVFDAVVDIDKISAILVRR